MSHFKPFLNNVCLVVLAGLIGLPSAAQVNPKWRATKSPDFLDLYQKSSSTTAKPEIATIFDFSGSMQSLMYHPSFYNDKLNDNGDPSGITFTLTGFKNSMKVTAVVGNNWYTTTELIRPDGSLVTEAIVNTTTVGTGLWGDSTSPNGQACDVRNWVRAASHIRLRSGSRTIDFPIPWQVMDASSTGVPLSSMTVKDEYVETDSDGVTHTYGSGQSIEVDTRFRRQEGFPDKTTLNNNIVLSGDKNTIVTTTKYMLRLNKTYVDWLFTGKYGTDITKPDYNPTLSGQYIVFDAGTTLAGGQTSAAQGQGFGTSLDGAMSFWNPLSQAFEVRTAKYNVIPARDRVQAVKEAAIRTWVKYQTRVFWAFRFLDDDGEAGGGSATTINHDSRSEIDATDATTTWVNGTDTGWTVLNKNSVAGMKRIAALFPYTNTPLCYATARTLAQFGDPNNIFGDVETDKDAPVECQKHFLILFTDGVPTSDNSSDSNPTTPYLVTGGSTGSAQDGNAALLAAPTSINPRGPWWNIFTYAGAAAHLADDAEKTAKENPITSFMTIPSAYPTGNSSPSDFLPFGISTRKTVPMTKDGRLITTITIGVSLGGDYTNAASPKRRLFLAAAVGDPERRIWNIGTTKITGNDPLTPFALQNPSQPDDPDNKKTANSVYFFDATTPDSLVSGLGRAFDATRAQGQTNSTSVPVIPWIGGGLSNQIYLAAFKVPEGGGPVWTGDLRMFPTKDVTLTDSVTGSKTQTLILDNTGVEVTGDLSEAANPGWSAYGRLIAKGWTDRTIYTRMKATTSDPNPPIYKIPTSLTKADLQTGDYKDLGTLVRGADFDRKLSNLQWMMGANPKDGKTRVDIMGDVLDSAPSFLEYANPTGLPTYLQPYWDAHASDNRHFRVIYVGTNQGVVHAFGEVTWDKKIGSGASAFTIKDGAVDELWAFIPTDILEYCEYYQTLTNPHVAGVNGTPYLYFLDLPATGARNGNGKMDIGSSLERATLITGLGKGGRSYYALDVRNPFSPKLGGTDNKGWALVPDEEESYPDTIFETATINKNLIRNMGWSTCQPTVGRVVWGTTTPILKDVVFVGGGFSLPEIEPTDVSGVKTRLGRSVLALDVVNGHILGTWALDDTKHGPVGAGVMPMQVSDNTSLTERAYFTDYFGGLWALGSTQDNSLKPGFRVDSSYMAKWASTPRPIYHEDRPNGLLSTMPAPFRVSNFYPRKSAPIEVPLTVGVALVSGDRNNPMDRSYTGTPGNIKPSQHRLTVVFDRQDSSKLGLDTDGIKSSQLANMSGPVLPTDTKIMPGSVDFYLSDSAFGYYQNFPTRATSDEFVAKGIVTPMVLVGKLFYSYFSPITSNPCDAGTGSTATVQVCNVMTPTSPGTGKKWSDSANAADARGCSSGEVFTWIGAASRFTPKSVLAALQAGMLPSSNTNDKTPDLKIKSFEGVPANYLAGPKVWRTVH